MKVQTLISLFTRIAIPLTGIKLIRPIGVYRGESACLGLGFNVTLSANEKVTGVSPYLLKSMGFFIACELREVRCLRSPLPVTCNSFAFSHFSFTGNNNANKYKEILWLI